MRLLKLLLILPTILALTVFTNATAHDDKKVQDSLRENSHQIQVESNDGSNNRSSKKLHSINEKSDLPKSGSTASLNDFPSLHPLIVHFPIVLLIMAALVQIASLFIFKKELSWMVLIITALGFFGSILAGYFVHPHVHGITDQASKVLEQHDFYAYLTIGISGISVLVKTASLFFCKRHLWIEVIVTVTLLATAFTVSKAGHFGAQLVHLEGIGPKGEYIDLNHHH